MDAVPPPSRLARFFDETVEASREAAGAVGGFIDRTCLIAGQPIRLRFAGEALLTHVLSPLAHLVAAQAPEPALTVHVWDSGSTGVALPASAWQADEHYFIRGELRGYNRRPDPGRPEYVLNLLHSGRDLAVYWVPRADRFPYLEKRLPLALVLYWWMCGRSTLMVHGGAVGTADGGVLLGGRGGSGKSTTTLACLDSGLDFAGDDYVLVRPGPEPLACSLYNTVKVGSGTLERFPALDRFAGRHGIRADGEVFLYLQERAPERLRACFPLKAILLPKVTGQAGTRLREASSFSALKAIAPSTIFQLPGPREEALRCLSELVRAVPCYELELGTELAEIPAAIARLLSPAGRVRR